MIPNSFDSAEVTSTLTAEKVAFTVDEASLAHIMMVLTNLYSDEEAAIVREYLTNALDSHKESGQTRPVEVSTPSAFRRTLIIEDFGLGMSIDDLKNTWSKYGASTKRDSDVAAGMLGLGSKSALTYTSSFTIVGRKNGVEASAVVTINEDGIPEFSILDTKATDESNGVRIEIPCRTNNGIHAKVKKFLSYWDEGSVLVDNVPNQTHDGLPADDIYFKMPDGSVTAAKIFYFEPPSYRWADITYKVVMGGVNYDVESQHLPEKFKESRYGFVIYVPMGAVSFVPSREALLYNKLTKQTIKHISQALLEGVVLAVREAIENAPGTYEAWKLLSGLPNWMMAHNLMTGASYNGLEFDKNESVKQAAIIHWDYEKSRKLEIARLSEIIEENPLLIVTNAPDKVNGHIRNKIKYHLTQNNLPDSRCVVIEGDDIDSPWVSHYPRVSYEYVKAIKVPRNASTAAPRTKTLYEFKVYDAVQKRWGTEFEESMSNANIVYLSTADLNRRWNEVKVGTLLEHVGQDFVVALMGKNSFDRFKLLHPQAQHIHEFAKEKIARLVAEVTDDDAFSHSIRYTQERFFKALDETKLDDVYLASKVAHLKSLSKTNKLDRIETFKNVIDRMGYSLYYNLPESPLQGILAKYPLIEHGEPGNVEDMTIYINAAYELRK